MNKYLWVLIASVSLWTGAAQATPLVYTASLSGAAEIPPNASPATGFATITIDTDAHTLLVDVDFQDLLGITTASHIHCCAPTGTNAGVATQTPTFSGFPLGVTSGSYTHLFDLTLASSFNASFITNFGGGTAAGAEAALASGLASGEAYFNIHTNLIPSGEIRGNLVVPEPATLSLLGLGFGTLIAARRKQRVREQGPAQHS